MLDPHDYTHLVSEVAVAKSDSFTLVTLPRPAGDMAYFRWRWAIRPVVDAQIARSLELSLTEAVRGRMAGSTANVPTVKAKFQVLVDAILVTGRCNPVTLVSLLPALASCMAETSVLTRPATVAHVAPAEQARRHVQTQAVGLPPVTSVPETDHIPTGNDQTLSTGLSTLCVVGDFDPPALNASLSALHWSRTLPTVDSDILAPEPSEPTLTVLEGAGNQLADVVMGQLIPSRTAPLGAAADLALTALAGAHRSDLNVMLREDHRLTYGVQSSVANLVGSSVYALRYSVPAPQAQQALSLTRTAIESLRQHGVSPQRLSDLQALRTGALVVSLDSSEGLCACLASLHLLGSRGDLIEHLRGYQSVTTDDLAVALDAFFDPDRMHVAVATPQRTALDWRTHG